VSCEIAVPAIESMLLLKMVLPAAVPSPVNKAIPATDVQVAVDIDRIP
jgi:hypothetical protein